MGHDDDNPRGYFESLPLSIADDELLAAANSRWDDWRQIEPAWFRSEIAQQHRHKIKALLIDEFGDEPLFFIKDPRICRFVPFMASILAELDISAVAILPIRNPLEVAYSLRRRNGFAPSKSILLWLRHVLEAEFHSRHMPRCFVRYDEFLFDWRRHIERVAKKTGVAWLNRAERPEVEVDRYLKSELYHERTSLAEIETHEAVTQSVRETYDILSKIATGDENDELLRRLDLLRSRFDESCQLFGAAGR